METSRLLPTLGLLSVTAVWGSTFFLIKDLVQQMPPLDFLGVRFALAAVLIGIFQFKRLREATRNDWIRGAILGGIYSAAQYFQTVGLQHTDASVSGFITGMYVVLTPVLLAVFFRQHVSRIAWVAVAIATAGLAFLSLEGLAFGTGETLTLVGALFYAFHIVFLGRWAHRSDPLTLGAVQLIAAGVLLGMGALPGGVVLPSTPGAWASLLYMTVIAGLGAVLMQTWAQSKLTATTAAIIMTTEPVFAAAFAIAFGGEHLTARLLIGGALILFAMMLIETGGSAPEEPDEEDMKEHKEAVEAINPSATSEPQNGPPGGRND